MSSKRSIVFAVLALIGILLIAFGLTERTIESMPEPDEPFTVPAVESTEPVALPVTADVSPLDIEYAVRNSDTGGGKAAWDNPFAATRVDSMSLRRMAPNSVLIPDLAIYMESRVSADETAARYQGYSTLKVPDNPRRAVMLDNGVPLSTSMSCTIDGDSCAGANELLADDEQGTSMLASHISTRQVSRGALRALVNIKQGTIIWTKDTDGKLQAWRAQSLSSMGHLEFPQELFSSIGPRQLALVTCGGAIQSNGHYAKNVIATAVPVATSITGTHG